MKKYIQYILVFLLLFTMTACNESSQENVASKSFKVSVVVPQKKSAVNSKFFKTSGDIVSILLVVIDSNGVEESHEMSYNGTLDTWSVDFTLSLANGPFTFRADAYDVSSPSLEGGDIPIFTGSAIFDPETDTETSIEIPLAETEVNVNTRLLPSLVSVEELSVNGDTRNYKFNVTNKQGGILEYAVNSVDENGDECTNSFFIYPDFTVTSINFDNVSGDSSFFELIYQAQTDCINPVHTLTLTVAETQDFIKVPIVVDDQSFSISIAFPPLIESVEVRQLEDSYEFELKVENSDNLTLSYDWSLAKGTGTLVNTTPNILEVSAYNQNIGLEVKVKVTNTTSGASSSFVYVVLEKVLVPNNDDTIFDESTGLVWAKDSDVSASSTWNTAIAYCETLNTNDANYDWRLPSIAELGNVYPNDIFSYNPYLWSINNVEGEENKDDFDETKTDDDAWYIVGSSGGISYGGGSGNVRCVSGTSATSNNVQSKVKKTGQKKSYDENGVEVRDDSLKDDGFYKIGVLPSYTRDATTQTVTDHVTRLVWQDNESITKPWLTQENYTGDFTNTEGATATTYCTDLRLDGKSDWRLPTRKELQGIVDYGEYTPAINNTFVNTASNNYWSSTTHARSSSIAWIVSFSSGLQYGYYKDGNYYVRCVRAGQ